MNKKILLFCLVLALAFLLFQSVSSYRILHDGKLHLIFCDVGQGDALIIKSSDGKILTLDGGPNEKIVTCLSQILPFWVKEVDLMMVTHPHVDHFLGDIPLLNSYKVDHFATENLSSNQKAYQLLLSLVTDKKVPKTVLSLGDRYQIGDLQIRVIGPSQELLSRSSPNGQIGESKEFASLLLLLEYGSFKAILPGDSQAGEMEEAIKKFGIKDITLLQAPHHGSATGLTEEIIARLHPKLAVISVGKKNRYGHPSSSLLNLFEEAKVPIYRTDKEGTIEVITDGRSYVIK